MCRSAHSSRFNSLIKAKPSKGGRLLLFVCCLLVSLHTSLSSLHSKAHLLLAVEPENPKCFAEGMQDLTCFWEEENGGTKEHYRFTYTYQYTNENSSECNVSELPAGGNKTWYICRPPKVQHFVPLDIRVFREGRLIHNRSLLIDHVFLLDPPANMTVTRTGQQGQLRVSWQPVRLAYMDNSMTYQISHSASGSRVGKINTVRAGRDLLLQGLQPDTSYDVRVRVKPSGLSYSGYWSVWAPAVSMETPPADLDLLLLVLCLTISLVIILLSLILLLSHRRFLLKKLWPEIPSPANKFQGLFTVYGGDFQEWMGFNTSDVRWRSAALFMGENPSVLEVLCEARFRPPAGICSVSSGASDLLTEVDLEEDEMAGKASPRSMEVCMGRPHHLWPFEQLQLAQKQHPLHTGHPPLEPNDTYVSLNQNSQPEGQESGPLDDVSDESCPLRVLFTDSGTPVSCSEFGSLKQSSGRVSSQLSLDYPHWPVKGGGYVCMTGTDSGISVDYSPMGTGTSMTANMGRISANKYDFLPSRCPYSGQPVQSSC
ncbi:erythropoietin receptor-like [Paramormyrops kingsleyae]